MKEYFKNLEKEWVEFASKTINAAPLSGDEGRCADVFLDAMKDLGVESFRDAVGNPVGIIRGTGEGPTILLTGHIDVVPGGNEDAWGDLSPHIAKVSDGKLYGRGISDMLGGLCSAFFAFIEVKKMVDAGHELKGNLVFAGNVQEEPAESLGALYLLNHTFPEHDIKVDLVYLAEPSNGNICLGHRGKVELVIDVHGKVAHSSTPQNGISALEKALPLIEALYKDLYEPVLSHPTGRTTMAITDVELTPGKTYSCVPDLCRIRVDRRYVPPLTLDDVIKQFEDYIKKLMEKDSEFKAEVYPGLNHRVCYTGYSDDVPKSHPFWEVSPDNEYVKLTMETLKEVGQTPEQKYWQFGTDGSAYCGIHGIPVIGYSCAPEEEAHQAKEHVVIEKMLECIEGYTAVLFKIYGFEFDKF